MKYLFCLLLASPLLFSCGNQSSSDVKAFCDCVQNPTPECESNMEKLEEEFKKDKVRYEKFAEAAREICPDAEKYISRMN